MKTKAKKRPKPSRYPEVWITFRTDGQISGVYESLEEAEADCWGPAFKEARIVPYVRKPGARAKNTK